LIGRSLQPSARLLTVCRFSDTAWGTGERTDPEVDRVPPRQKILVTHNSLRNGLHAAALTTTVLVVSAAAVVAPSSQAALAPLHLSAVVYGKHTSSNGSFSSHERLSANGKRAGEDFSRCTRVDGGHDYKCSGSYKLTHGTIDFSGEIPAGKNSNTLNITGGTGSYKNVRGHVHTVYNAAGTRATETLTFSG
jgi:hypothetical protein